MSLNQVALAIDGAFNMTGHRRGLMVRMRAKVPTLINVHCIAHREALVPRHATIAFPEFQMLDHFANKIYDWLGMQIETTTETIVA